MGATTTDPKPRFRIAIWWVQCNVGRLAHTLTQIVTCSGAGIAGLALATVLGRFVPKESPLEVNIYERHTGITTFGAGISVWQRTWRVMQLLGIDDQLAKALSHKR